MRIGVIQIELSIPGAMSLKDKRRVVRRMKDRIAQKFNVSVAEVADNDIWRSAVLGVAVVGNDAKFLQGVCQKVVNFVEDEAGEANLEDYQVEII